LIGDAEVELEIAQRAHDLAAEEERSAAAELARLTEEDSARRREELIAAKREQALTLVEQQNSAADDIARWHWQLCALTEELSKLGATGVVSDINVFRLDMRGLPGILSRKVPPGIKPEGGARGGS
jgi:formiminotetrahydrofolate cyclodeaminase